MDTNILISIITPTFNRAYILGTAIESVLAQSYTNWEMIIVDDGSTDNTKELVENFGDERIGYIKQENNGQASARNRGLREANGEYIAYLDSDNELFPNYLEVMLKTFGVRENILYILPRANRTLELYENDKLVKSMDDSSDFPSSLIIKDVFLRKLHVDINGFIHSSLIKDEGIRFDEKIPSMEDWDFIMLIGERHPDNFLFLPMTLLNYHQRFGGDGAVSNTPYRKWAEAFEYIYQKHKNDKLLQGQDWYPDRVRKWNKIADDYEKGLAPPPHLYYFK